MIRRQVSYAAVPLLVIGLIAFQALSAPQGRDQRQCIDAMNGNGAKVGKTQGKDMGSCLKDAGRSDLGPLPLSGQLEECFVADVDGRVVKVKGRAVTRENKRCLPSTLPEFAVPALQGTYNSSSNNYSGVVNVAAIDAQLAVAHDLLGFPADGAVINASTDRIGSSCQRSMLGAVQRCVAEKLKTFNRCKKLGLKDASIGSAAQLETQCLTTGGNPATDQPDPKGKIAQRCQGKFSSTIAKKCVGLSLAAAFPGLCGSAGDIPGCLKERAACRTCQQLNRTDNLNRDCDLFDDGTDNSSCPNVLPLCGDGIQDAATEACDDGNTANGDCCSSTCHFETVGSTCGDQTDDGCTNPDTCNASGVCLPNHESAGASCGDPADTECTNPDTCDGSGVCQANHEAASTTCGDPADTDCTNPDTCDGAGSCQSNHATTGASCGNPSDTDCTNPDTCDAAGTCQSNHETTGSSCTDDGNDCTDDVCDAVGACTHPALVSGTACGNPADTDCTNPDSCDGSGICLSNDEITGTTCGDPSDTDCSNPDTCNGLGTCLSNDEASGFSCGDPLDTDCTDPDTCNGAGTCLPHNEVTGLPCSNDSNDCTTDVCNSSGLCTHPALPSGTVCGDQTDTECTNPDTCDSGGTCLSNHEPGGASCGDPTDTECNNADSCDGTGACVPNFETSGVSCGDPSDTDCTNPDTCNGSGTCLANHATSGSTCGDPSDTECTDPDTCNGSGTCLSNHEVTGTTCGSPADTDCTNPDTCNGSGLCQDNHETSGSGCTTDGNDCTSDICNSAGSCTHPNVPSGTACGSPLDTACTDPDTCNASGTCLANHASSGTACPDDGNVCTNDQCNGSGTCAHPNNTVPCNDGVFCNGSDTCSGGACSVHGTNPCPGPDGDGNCSESCNEAADNCTASDPNGSACTDGLFCNGSDTCSGGACSVHGTNPCPGADGDGDCSESCNEAADNCTASDPNGSACNDGTFCNGADTCSGGACSGHAGNPCPGPDGDGNCSESCNEAADNCTAADPNGSGCNDGLGCNGADTCSGGSCSAHAGVCCGSQLFTFTVNSNNGGVFDSAEWPGGTTSQNGPAGCSVTINRPNDNIDLVCTLAAPFSVNSFSGYSNCFGTGGEDGDGCQPVFCPPAGIGSCCSTRPSCSAALNGSGQARYFVQCVDP